MVRRIIGDDHRFLLAASTITGGLLLLASDTVAGIVLPPYSAGIRADIVSGCSDFYLYHPKRIQKIKQRKAMNRNIGLDYIRASALLLMMSIHYARLIPETLLLNKVFKCIGESAPAFFFFAFGMTIDRFLSKDICLRWHLNILFLYVALMHNLLWRKLIITDFLFFLWVWQFVLHIIELKDLRSNKFYVTLLFIVFFSMLFLPAYYISAIFKMIIEGPFQLLPWGSFVIAGLIFSRTDLKNYRFSIFLMIISFCLYYVSTHNQYFSFKIVKWPLTVPYVFLLTSINVIIINFINNHKKIFLKQMKHVTKLLTFISKNLLLGTVLHLCVLTIAENVFIKHFPEEFLSRFETAFVFIGALCSILSLIIVTYLVAIIWAKIKTAKIFILFRNEFDLAAISIIIITSVFAETINLLKLEHLYILYSCCVIFVMTYFTLELPELKKRYKRRLLP